MVTMKRIHNKEDIVQVGLDIVLSKGFNATGVETILKQANIPKGSFYNFFSSKEEFALAIIDSYVANMAKNLHTVLNSESLPPLERVRKSFETVIKTFEDNDCSKGCLIGNLSQEMADQCESIRQRLEDSLQMWSRVLSELLLQAQREEAISADMDVDMLAENILSSFQGAVLRAKVKKSSEPLRIFIHLYFDVFLSTAKP